jgi:hypothetical protein
MPTLGVETSIVSNLRSQPSGQVVDAARQRTPRLCPKGFDVLDHAGLAKPISCTTEELLSDDKEIS